MENNNKQSIRVMAFWGVSALVLGGMIFGMVKIASHNSPNNKIPKPELKPLAKLKCRPWSAYRFYGHVA